MRAPEATPFVPKAKPTHSRRPALVLASASPRRRALLATLGLTFAVVAPDVDESPRDGESAEALATRLALAKAAAIRRADAVVLAADTVVTQRGHIFGKPRDAAEAVQMLTRLRGTRHEVITGVCARPVGGPPLLAAARTFVWMRPYSEEELRAYVATGAPFDKAGGYGIQDAPFRPVARIEGCYTNVVGLPLCVTRAVLHRAGVELRRARPACEHAGT
ncbi:MAG TPA: Maf family protein [Chloroflexota bacterium]|nr:Maf family protein [Chloroflexota bacterium]